MTLNNEIPIIAISGIINYWFFNQLNLFSFFNNKADDERNVLIILLGLVNIVSFQFISNKLELNVLFTMIISLIVSIVLELIVLFIIKKVSELVISKYYKNKRSYNFFENTLVYFLEEHGGKELFVYIYDFEDKLIDYGYVSSYSYQNSENNIVLALPDDYELQNEANNFKKLDYERVFIDFDRQIKIYPFVVNEYTMV